LIKSKCVSSDPLPFFANIDQVVLRTKIASRLGL
jgi:hypothetical protein